MTSSTSHSLGPTPIWCVAKGAELCVHLICMHPTHATFKPLVRASTMRTPCTHLGGRALWFVGVCPCWFVLQDCRNAIDQWSMRFPPVDIATSHPSDIYFCRNLLGFSLEGRHVEVPNAMLCSVPWWGIAGTQPTAPYSGRTRAMASLHLNSPHPAHSTSLPFGSCKATIVIGR